jgi:hypothetical protein
MYDTVIFLDGAPRCPAGHEVGSFQTKDFECQMHDYYVSGERLYSETSETEHSRHEVNGEILTFTRTSEMRRYDFTGQVSVYGYCERCRPVLLLKERAFGGPYGDLVDERRPWQEWRLTLDRGVVTGVEPVRNETRDDVREKLARDELKRDLILDDDERLARRHFELRDARGKGDE